MQVLRVVLQQAAGDGAAGADVGEIRGGSADAFVAANGVADNAGFGLEEGPALGDQLGVLGPGDRDLLLLLPGGQRIGVKLLRIPRGIAARIVEGVAGKLRAGRRRGAGLHGRRYNTRASHRSRPCECC